MKRRTALFLLFLLPSVVFSLTGCTETSAPKLNAPKYIRYSSGPEPSSLDPRKSNGIPEINIENQIFEGLTALDAAGSVIPAAAERWEVSPDFLTYKFHLRKSGKWSNGEPVTAHDFEFAWKETLSPDIASKNAYLLYCLRNGEAYNSKKVNRDEVGVRAIDDYTLEVRLQTPLPAFLTLLIQNPFFPVHKKTVTQNPLWATDPRTLIGNGPFKMTQWVHNSKIEFIPNEYYWDRSKVKLPKLEFYLVDSSATELAMFENHQVDMGDNPPRQDLERLKKENKVAFYPYFATYYLYFNTTKAPLDNPKVRKALMLGIDRQTIISEIFKGGETAAMGLVPYGAGDVSPSKDFRQSAGALFRDNDVATAKKLLAEAGYPDGKGLPPITLLYNTSEQHKTFAEAVQEMWLKNLGVTVALVNQEWKAYLVSLEGGDYQIARGGYVGVYQDASTLLDLFVTKGGNNYSRYSNPQYDELIRLARSNTDAKIRIKALHDAEQLLIADDAVVAPIYFYTRPTLVSPEVKGFIRTALGQTYFKEAYVE